MARICVRRIAKPIVKFSRKMRTVAKAAVVGDFAKRSTRTQQYVTVWKIRGAI
jgi:hypothetical protein